MSIVLNENDWAAKMIKSRSLGNKPYETLCRVAKYYAENDGYSKSGVRDKIEEFLLLCEPSASITKWSHTLDIVVNRAFKYKSINIDCINITDKEMAKIDSLDSRQMKRLAFTLLCLAKYWDAVNPNGDHWVNSRDSEIMCMANISASVRRQSALYHELNQLGMIQFSKKIDNTNVRVLFMEEGVTVYTVYDFNNLGYQYQMYHGEPFFICENCGTTTKMKNPNVGRRQKYCSDCAAEIMVKQNVNSVMRGRGKINETP